MTATRLLLVLILKTVMRLVLVVANLTVTSGAVFVFIRNISTWTQKSYVKASNTGSGDQFGYLVSLSDDGDTLSVGGDRERSLAIGINGDQTDDAAFAAGAVYLY